MNKRFFIVPLFFASLLLSQNVNKAETTLLDIQVSGNNLTTETMILYSSGLHKGDLIKPGDFSQNIKRLWRLGLFSDIQITLDKETPAGIEITIHVKENFLLGEIRYKGNKKLKKSKFEEKIEFSTGQRIKPNTITELIRQLKSLYKEDGYLLADISAELVETKLENLPNEKIKSNTRDIIFTIKEGKKVKIKKIIFEGNHAISDRKLRRKLKETKQQHWYLFWRSGFDEDKFEEDKLLLETFYRNQGYRDFTILSDSIHYDERKRKLSIIFKLSEGEKYKFRNFSWEGNSLFTTEELTHMLNISKGDEYSEEKFNLAVFDWVQGLYMDRGYIYSQIIPEITPVGTDSLDVHFSITENHKVFVRNILITGNTKTRENVIRRELKIYPGDVFSRNKLIRSQREVWILNYFGNVVPNVLPVDEDEIDLEIAVEEKSSDRASANVGFTGEYGMTGGGGLEFNNFMGLGQRLNLSFNVGTNYSVYRRTTPSKYRSFSLSFTDPMIWDTPNLIGFSLFYTFRGASTNYSFPLDYSLKGFSTSWGRRFKFPDDFFRGNWHFGIVQKEYDGTEDDLNTYISGLKMTKGVSITQAISRDSRDRPEFTTRGSRVIWTTKLSGGRFGGNEDFHKHVLELEWYTPTFWKFVLTSSFKIGVIKPITSYGEGISVIPFDEKFILGGNGIPYGNMLRGYPDNSIGPVSSTGRPLGGNTMIKFGTEYRFPFSENPVVYGTIFAEMGNVWNTTDMTEPFYLPRNEPLNLKRTVGVGVRFFMPMIGLLGFDLGYGFDDISGDGKPEGWTTTITFGQPF